MPKTWASRDAISSITSFGHSTTYICVAFAINHNAPRSPHLHPSLCPHRHVIGLPRLSDFAVLKFLYLEHKNSNITLGDSLGMQYELRIITFQNRATERVAITSAIAMESIALKSPAGNRAIATTERASSKNAKTTSYSNRIVATLARQKNPYAITLVSIRKQTSTIVVRAVIHARSIKLPIRRLSTARAVNVLQRIAIQIPICKTESASKARLSSVAMQK